MTNYRMSITDMLKVAEHQCFRHRQREWALQLFALRMALRGSDV